jgi:hypothetical protein
MASSSANVCIGCVIPILDILTFQISNLTNTVVVDNYTLGGRTISYEIGQGKFYLFHPDDISGCAENGWKVNKLKTQTNNHLLYYMNIGYTIAQYKTNISVNPFLADY